MKKDIIDNSLRLKVEQLRTNYQMPEARNLKEPGQSLDNAINDSFRKYQNRPLVSSTIIFPIAHQFRQIRVTEKKRSTDLPSADPAQYLMKS